MMLCSRELSLLTTRNSIRPVFSSVTAGFSGKSTGVGVMGGSDCDSDDILPLCSGDSVLAFFDLNEDASSEAFLLVAVKRESVYLSQIRTEDRG